MINSRTSCSEKTISRYSTNELWDKSRMEIELHFPFPRLTSCWDSAALILLVMSGAKQQQWINKITHLNMPVNLIILEQREKRGRGGRGHSKMVDRGRGAGTRGCWKDSDFAFCFIIVPQLTVAEIKAWSTLFIKFCSTIDANRHQGYKKFCMYFLFSFVHLCSDVTAAAISWKWI